MKTRKKKRFWLLPVLIIVCGVCGIFLQIRHQENAAEGTMAVHFIDVGQGLAILVQSGGENLLYDGGDSTHADQVISYLEQQDVKKIDYMIASHYDKDHISGLIDCMEEFPVENLFGPDYIHPSDLFNTFMNTATANAIIVQYPEPGDTCSFGTGSFTILAPNGIHPDGSNENSVVIKLKNGSTSFLFTGDAEETSEQDMISARRNLDCDVLCVGHHGSATSTTWDFLEATSPSYAVISCGTGNRYEHPTAETMGRLSAMKIPVFRTDKQGSLIALSDGKTITWNEPPCNDYSPGTSVQESEDEEVWLSATGDEYHSIPDCGRMNPAKARQVTEADAIAQGYGACSKCH